MRKLVCILLCIASAVFMATGVFASSNTELVTYTLSYDEMNTLLSSSLCMVTVIDQSSGGSSNSFQLDVTRRSDLDNDYLYFSTDSFPTASQYQVNFSFVYPGSPSNPIVNDIYSLDIDIVSFFTTSSPSSSTTFIPPNIGFGPSFYHPDFTSNVLYSSSNSNTTHSYSVPLGNGSTVSTTRFICSYTPNVTPVDFYAFIVSTIKIPTVTSRNYLYLGLKPFTFTAPDDTVNEIVSAIEDLKQNIDKNTQDIIDNQNKNQEQLEDFLGTPSDDDNSVISDLESNISSSTEKADEISSALESVEKPNLDNIDFDITDSENFDSSYLVVLNTIFGNAFFVTLLVICFTCYFIAYLLYGKKG